MQITPEPRVTATLDDAALYDAIDPDGPYVPALVSGAARPRDPLDGEPVRLALAINGVVRATTEPASGPILGRRGMWLALVQPDAYRAGPNDIDVFEITSLAPPVLRRVLFDARRGEPANLLEEGLSLALGVFHAGLHPPEWDDATLFRWTNGSGRLVVPIGQGQPPPRTLEVTVRMGRDAEQILEIRANRCLLFQGTLTEPSRKMLDLSPCGDLGTTLSVTFDSDTFVPGATDPRTLGVALSSVRLHQ
jgi:hypothetical protein